MLFDFTPSHDHAWSYPRYRPDPPSGHARLQLCLLSSAAKGTPPRASTTIPNRKGSTQLGAQLFEGTTRVALGRPMAAVRSRA